MATDWELKVEKQGDKYIIVAVRDISSAAYASEEGPQQGTREVKRYWTETKYVKKIYFTPPYKYEDEKEAVEEMQRLERGKIYPTD